MTVAYPIPRAALLDDRLAIVGTSGSGKTYAAKGAVERLFAKAERVGIVDPLGVWWGLRLDPDGKSPSPFGGLMIFGGERGDVGLTESAGGAVGKLLARSSFSWLIDLSELGSGAARRRFMVPFAEALYAGNREPLHLILDEADLWAPQRPIEDNQKLLGARIEEIVRRGRVRGFVPWLITQRPAVLAKDVLSQADTLIAMKLTASQDRDAIGGWIEGQADKADGKRILGELPRLTVGEGFVWSPGHGVLERALFPAIATYDSSRTPKRGERPTTPVLTKPLDASLLDGLRKELAEIETESAANDPKALRKRIAELEREVFEAKAYAGPTAEATNTAYREGYDAGHMKALDEERVHWTNARVWVNTISDVAKMIEGQVERCRRLSDEVNRATARGAAVGVPVKFGAMPPPKTVAVTVAPQQHRDLKSDISRPQQRVLDAIRWWNAAGEDAPTRTQIGIVAGYSPGSGSFANLLSSLLTAGLIMYPRAGVAALTATGVIAAATPGASPTNREMHERVFAIVGAPQRKVLEPLLEAYPDALTRSDVAKVAGYSAGSGGFANLLGSLRSLGVIGYPFPGQVIALPILFPGGRR